MSIKLSSSIVELNAIRALSSSFINEELSLDCSPHLSLSGISDGDELDIYDFLKNEQSCLSRDKFLEYEVESLKNILYSRYGNLVDYIICLFEGMDIFEVYKRISVILCKNTKRRTEFLSNWQLKRLLADVNYLIYKSGFKRLQFVDHKVRISVKAVSVSKMTGFGDCYNKGSVYLRETVIKRGVIDEEFTNRLLKWRRENKIKSIKNLMRNEERSKGNLKIEFIKEKEILNPLSNPSSKKVEIKRKEMEMSKKTFVPLGEEPKINMGLKELCFDETVKLAEYNIKKSYKQALIGKMDEVEADAIGKLQSLTEEIRSVKVLDDDLAKDFVNREFLGVEPMAREQLPYNEYKIFRKRFKEDRIDSLKKIIDDGSKKEKKENKIKFLGLDISLLKLKKFREEIDKEPIFEPKLNKILGKRIVEDNYFSYKLIERGVKDYKHSQKTNNPPNSDSTRCRKHRLRSILDEYFGTCSIPEGKRGKYKSKNKREGKIIFNTPSVERVIKKFTKIDCNSEYQNSWFIDEERDRTRENLKFIKVKGCLKELRNIKMRSSFVLSSGIKRDFGTYDSFKSRINSEILHNNERFRKKQNTGITLFCCQQVSLPKISRLPVRPFPKFKANGEMLTEKEEKRERSRIKAQNRKRNELIETHEKIMSSGITDEEGNREKIISEISAIMEMEESEVSEEILFEQISPIYEYNKELKIYEEKYKEGIEGLKELKPFYVDYVEKEREKMWDSEEEEDTYFN